eukprot:3731494-Rhodomonas_salina.1
MIWKGHVASRKSKLFWECAMLHDPFSELVAAFTPPNAQPCNVFSLVEEACSILNAVTWRCGQRVAFIVVEPLN